MDLYVYIKSDDKLYNDLFILLRQQIKSLQQSPQHDQIEASTDQGQGCTLYNYYA